MVLQRFAILPPLQLLHLLKKNWAGMFEISRTFTSHCKKIVCFFFSWFEKDHKKDRGFFLLKCIHAMFPICLQVYFPAHFYHDVWRFTYNCHDMTQGAVAKQKQHSAVLILIFLISWRRPVKRRFKIIFNFRNIPRKKKKKFLIFIFLASSGFYYNFFVETWRWFSFWAKTFFWLRILERGRSAFSLNPFKTIM